MVSSQLAGKNPPDPAVIFPGGHAPRPPEGCALHTTCFTLVVPKSYPQQKSCMNANAKVVVNEISTTVHILHKKIFEPPINSSFINVHSKSDVNSLLTFYSHLCSDCGQYCYFVHDFQKLNSLQATAHAPNSIKHCTCIYACA